MPATNSKIRTRFAPSPTGYIHIGNFRTALFGFLFARAQGGTFLLRVEDTDQSRKVEGAVEQLIETMKTMGVVFDEGVHMASGVVEQQGEYGPYIQSERLAIYNEHVQQLLANKKAYYCFCSSERLDELRKEQTALKQPPMYDRHCRNLSDEVVQEKLKEFSSQDKAPVVRQMIPLDGKTVVHDLVYGDIEYQHALLDDQVLLKSDGFPTYHLAVVIDDHFMEISHITRGEEWLPSTAKHVLLYGDFGWTAPQFAHFPLILNPDKTKLSKRQGDVSVEDFLSKGYLPQALVNFVALLGWNPKTEQELFTMNELIAQFDLSKVNNSGAVLDKDKLDWMNGMYIRAMADEALLPLLTPYLKTAGIDVAAYKPEFIAKIIAIEKDRLKTLAQIADATQFYFEQPSYDGALLVWKKADAVDAKTKLTALKNWFAELPEESFERATLEENLKKWITQNGFDNGSVLWPLRVALTGLERSPGPFDVAHILHAGYGKEGIVARLEAASNKL